MDANPFGDDATRQCHHQFGSLTDNPFGGGVDASGHHQSEEVREDRGSKLAYVRGHAAAHDGDVETIRARGKLPPEARGGASQ